jgi:hypothetical protein
MTSPLHLRMAIPSMVVYLPFIFCREAGRWVVIQ